MLYKALRSIKGEVSVETRDNKRYNGRAHIDTKLNISIDNHQIRASNLRYVMLSDEDTARIMQHVEKEKSTPSAVLHISPTDI
ncbi:uncharacterized protein NEMAJ01_2099 [Nematocida major]|uniref:uncharacterized protein n=1 Tax=Nematocida major TaxID=1912982 RepID=UPI0020080D36|nr:uncharacterized protein NEMAJ01_2099 [Nematocida major]KAH9387203.1 hypothetical protein NEMAJ01_2099 [Nematocida major]